MDYLLAKELKDAGFKQMGFGVAYGSGMKGTEAVYYPTLEELIAACEKGELLLSCYGKGRYIARVGYFVASTPEQEAAGYPQMAAHIKVEAPTLVEAVARLWLELQAKQN